MIPALVLYIKIYISIQEYCQAIGQEKGQLLIRMLP
jgi:hypothetical protein